MVEGILGALIVIVTLVVLFVAWCAYRAAPWHLR